MTIEQVRQWHLNQAALQRAKEASSFGVVPTKKRYRQWMRFHDNAAEAISKVLVPVCSEPAVMTQPELQNPVKGKETGKESIPRWVEHAAECVLETEDRFGRDNEGTGPTYSDEQCKEHADKRLKEIKDVIMACIPVGNPDWIEAAAESILWGFSMSSPQDHKWICSIIRKHIFHD